jgi:hypothetical protein
MLSSDQRPDHMPKVTGAADIRRRQFPLSPVADISLRHPAKGKAEAGSVTAAMDDGAGHREVLEAGSVARAVNRL